MPTVTKTKKRPPWAPPARKPFERSLGKANRDVYDSSRWKADRKAHREAYPLCVKCLENGLAVDSVVSDHIVPINQGGDVWSWDNRQMLCMPCHEEKSRKEAREARAR